MDPWPECANCHDWSPLFTYDSNYPIYFANTIAYDELKAYKYGQSRESGRLLARVLAGHLLQNEARYRPYDFIVSMPWLAGTRGAKFDHMARVLRTAADHVNWEPSPFTQTILEKCSPTPSLAGLGKRERLALSEEIHSAFRVIDGAPCLSGTHVLIVDDIMTSGTSLAAAAKRLRSHGAARVSGLTILRTKGARV